LPKLVEPLGRFFDLGQMRLEGQAGGQITVLRKQPDRFQVAGGGFLRSFHCELVKGQAWNEESLTLTVHADGKNMPSGAQQIDGGYVQIRSGNDLLDIQVLEPIVDPLKGPWGNLQVKVEGDLTRWQERARPWTGALEGWPLAGNLAAKVDVQSASKRLGYDADVTVTNFVLGPAANPKWRESQIRLASKGAVDWAKDNCRFDQVLLESQFIRCVATGGLGGLSTTQDVDIAGQLTYDLEKLGPFLRPYLGSGVKVTGRDARPFTLNGPLAPRTVNQGVTLTVPSQTSLVALKGDAGLGWKTLKAYGCDVGPAEVRAKLNGGWLLLDPMETTLNGGRLRLAANLRLQPEPMLLQLPQGPVVDHAQITPAMCASALGYAIPALSGAAEADGLVSLTLEGGTLNLADMTKSELRGTFTLHSATIGGGPLVRELSGLLRSPRPASLVKETRVPFQVAGGRVYHQNFELAFPDFTVRTSGSVGMDGTVALVAEMPVPPKWLGNNPLGSALAKQTIRLPITGTLDNPRIDPHALQAASAEFLRGAASDVIRQGLDNNLKKLLGR
jgi:translocation and assembly module TamB